MGRLRKKKARRLSKATRRGVWIGVCDFGDSFTVIDQDGEEPKTCIIASISNEHPALVTCTDDERVELEEGDFVTFRVKGMTELNSIKERVKIKSVKNMGLSWTSTRASFRNTLAGIAQVKLPS